MPIFLDVDPASLRVPPSRMHGADPGKLARQLSKHGLSIAGMPDIIVVRGRNGVMKILDGVTRATRVAKWLPGQLVRVEVIQELSNVDFSPLPRIGDLLP